MADEQTQTGTGAAEAIDKLFGGGSEPEKTETPEQQQTGTPDPSRPDWAPENFWKEGKLDGQAWGKSWKDTRAELTRAQQRVKELEKARGSSEEVPEAADAYWKDQAFDELKGKAPKAFTLAGGNEGASVQAFLRTAHANGIGPEKARAMLGSYLEQLEPTLPDTIGQTQEERFKAAVAAQGPNGARIATDTQRWLRAQAEKGAFTENQVSLLGDLVSDGEGLGLLYALIRQRQDAGPPVSDTTGTLDVHSEEQDVWKAMQDPETWKDPEKRRDVERRFAAVRKRGGLADKVNPTNPAMVA